MAQERDSFGPSYIYIYIFLYRGKITNHRRGEPPCYLDFGLLQCVHGKHQVSPGSRRGLPWSCKGGEDSGGEEGERAELSPWPTQKASRPRPPCVLPSRPVYLLARPLLKRVCDTSPDTNRYREADFNFRRYVLLIIYRFFFVNRVTNLKMMGHPLQLLFNLF